MNAGPRYWLARLIVALEVLVTVVIVSWFEEASLTAQAIERTGEFGWVVVVLLAGACMVAIADGLFNDILHRRCRWFVSAKNGRHLGFLAIAILLGVLGVLVAFTSGFTPLLLVYWINAALAAVAAFLDAFARIRAC